MYLGFVLVRMTCKVIGIGADDRYWGDVKHINKDKVAHMGAKHL